MELIEFKRTDGFNVAINPKMVIFVEMNSFRSTRIHFERKDLLVQESYEDVLEKLRRVGL